MITLTPSGDILIEGLGKVGEYYKGRKQKPSAKLRTSHGYKYLYEPNKDKLIQDINNRITNGFTPKKWEE